LQEAIQHKVQHKADRNSHARLSFGKCEALRNLKRLNFSYEQVAVIPKVDIRFVQKAQTKRTTCTTVPPPEFAEPDEAKATLQEVVQICNLMNITTLTVIRVRPPKNIDLDEERAEYLDRVVLENVRYVADALTKLGVEDVSHALRVVEGTKAQYFAFSFAATKSHTTFKDPEAKRWSELHINIDMRAFRQGEEENPSSPQEAAERQKRIGNILKRGRVKFCERTGKIQMPKHMFELEKYEDIPKKPLSAVPNDHVGAFEDVAAIADLFGVDAGVVRHTRTKVNRKEWDERMILESWAQRLEEARANSVQEKLMEMGVKVPKVFASGKCVSEVDRCEKFKVEAQLRTLAKSNNPNDVEALEKALTWADYVSYNQSRPSLSVRKEAEDNLERLRQMERRIRCRKDYLEKEMSGENRPRVKIYDRNPYV
jgi:hypothetical protein